MFHFHQHCFYVDLTLWKCSKLLSVYLTYGSSNYTKKNTSAALYIYDFWVDRRRLLDLIGELCWLVTKLMDEGKILSFSSVLPESQGILSSFAFIDFLSVALIKIAVLHCNLLAWNEVGINQPLVKYSNFIIVQNDYGSELASTVWLI